MFNYMIVVNDNGELKTVSSSELSEAVDDDRAPDAGQTAIRMDIALENLLNWVLDRKSEQEEENAAIIERATELPDPERD